jgi:uroporphyrinogen-III decarboxylase
MSPRLFDALVARYDGPLFDLVHEHDCYVHVHCHGRIAGVLDRWADLGADLLDPVEPPPQGDIEMGEAKRQVDAQITLMGNIEFRDLEFATPDEIEEKVRRAIEDGGKKHTILYPSARGITEVSEQYRDNAIRYIEAGLKYGKMG